MAPTRGPDKPFDSSAIRQTIHAVQEPFRIELDAPSLGLQAERAPQISWRVALKTKQLARAGATLLRTLTIASRGEETLERDRAAAPLSQITAFD